MPASYNIETSFLRCQHIFRWPPSPSLEPVSNYLHSEWGNHTTFAQPPSPFRPRSGVVPIPPLFPDRYRTISERGTRFEWQERKTERLVVVDCLTLVQDRSGHFPQHWWSFRLRSYYPMMSILTQLIWLLVFWFITWRQPCGATSIFDGFIFNAPFGELQKFILCQT